MTRAFNSKSTADDVLAGMDLAGKRYLVTGTSAGIGVETHGRWWHAVRTSWGPSGTWPRLARLPLACAKPRPALDPAKAGQLWASSEEWIRGA